MVGRELFYEEDCLWLPLIRAHGDECPPGDWFPVEVIRRLITDDHRLFVAAIRLGLSPMFLPDLVIWLVSRGRMAHDLGQEILAAIQPRYTKGFIELSLRQLEGVI